MTVTRLIGVVLGLAGVILVCLQPLFGTPDDKHTHYDTFGQRITGYLLVVISSLSSASSSGKRVLVSFLT